MNSSQFCSIELNTQVLLLITHMAVPQDEASLTCLGLSLHRPLSTPNPLSVSFCFWSAHSGVLVNISKTIFCSENHSGSEQGGGNKKQQKRHFPLHMMVLITHQQPPSCCDLRIPQSLLHRKLYQGTGRFSSHLAHSFMVRGQAVINLGLKPLKLIFQKTVSMSPHDFSWTTHTSFSLVGKKVALFGFKKKINLDCH